MKIGLLTIYHVPNYGSVLQTYATQKILEKLGHECIVVQYNYRNDEFYAKEGRKRNKFQEWKLNNVPFLKSAKLQRFRKKYLNFSKQYETHEDLRQADWSNFDLFLVGSDQVWNTKYVYGDTAFLLDFVPDEKPRISLSSSFALKSLPVENIDTFRIHLSKFSALSVRENNGVDIINNDLSIKKEVKVTLDPTLLLSCDEWMHNISRSSSKRKKPYILLYMWTYALEPRPYIFRVVEYYTKTLNADVLVLEGHRELEGMMCPFIDVNRSSVSEFIDLFANADLVITCSFHGTAFAVNFGIPVLSIVPDGDEDDRQSSLLRMIGAENSIVRIGTPLSQLNPYYNADAVANKLNHYRTDNIKWLSDNIDAVKQ